MKTQAIVRRAQRDDLEAVVRWMNEPDFHYFLYGDPARSPRQVREQIVKMLGRAPGSGAPDNLYMVIDSPREGPLGLISLQQISWRNRGCMLDLYIGAAHLRRRSVAAIAAYRALEYCFDELNLHRITAYIYAFNTASWRLLERTGAKRELVLREHVAREGALHDLYGYGLLREEFDAWRREMGARTERFSLEAMAADLAQAFPDTAE